MTWKVLKKANRKVCNYYKNGGCTNSDVDSRYCYKKECTLRTGDGELETDIKHKAEELYRLEEREAIQNEDELLDEELGIPF